MDRVNYLVPVDAPGSKARHLTSASRPCPSATCSRRRPARRCSRLILDPAPAGAGDAADGRHGCFGDIDNANRRSDKRPSVNKKGLG